MNTDKTTNEEQGNSTNLLLNAVPTTDEVLKPFEPYIKRFGFGYIHFKNGTGLLAKEFGAIAKEIWDKNQTDYNKNVDEWCQRHCI